MGFTKDSVVSTIWNPPFPALQPIAAPADKLLQGRVGYFLSISFLCCAEASRMDMVTRASSLCLDLGLGALKAPKEAEEGGRAASGSARKGRRQHSSPQNPLLDCSLCGKVFSSASSLSKHYLTHSQERKHVCKICSKAFKRQDHLYVAASPAGRAR